MYKNRIHSLLKENGYKISKESLEKEKTKELIFSLPLSSTVKLEIELIYKELENLTEAIEKIKGEILKKGKIFDKEIRLLIGIKGISVFTAIGIMSDVVDINRFPSAKKFCSYLRAAPKVDSSNQTTRVGKINKKSRKLSMSFMLQSVTHFRSYNKYDKFYNKKKTGNSAGKARIATVRKVMVAIYHMLKKEQCFYYTDKERYEVKLKKYENFLKKIA